MRRASTAVMIAALAIIFGTAPAYGQTGKKFGGEKFLERLKAQDKNKDGKITKDEAEGPLKRGFARFDLNNDGVIDQTELKKLAGRFGNGRPGGGGVPVGKVAPDFELKSVDGKKVVKLSSFTDKKPVALIFGSYT